MPKNIIKRNGAKVKYTYDRIYNAIERAMLETTGKIDSSVLENVAMEVDKNIDKTYFSNDLVPHVENVQDLIEQTLIKHNLSEIAKAYILYREKRKSIRDMEDDLMGIYEDLTFKDAKDSDLKRENGNISGDEPMAIMLRYGSEGAKMYNEAKVLPPDISEAHINGDIHIHDLDFYTLTETCCQINLSKLFEKGFDTGHGNIRPPKSIRSAMSLAAVILQANQNQQHGGQSIPAFDYYLAPYVALSFKSNYIKNLKRFLQVVSKVDISFFDRLVDEAVSEATEELKMDNMANYQHQELALLDSLCRDNKLEEYVEDIPYAQKQALDLAIIDTKEDTYQAAEAFIHNMNSLHSRSGGQVVFSSINLGTDTSTEGRMVTENILLATEAGMGNGETPIFPISIFKTKDGINGEPGDPNYDLFLLACRVSAKRLFPNFSFIDAPYNLSIYKEGNPDTEIAYMGCLYRGETVITDGYIKSNKRQSIGKLYECIDYLYNHKDDIIGNMLCKEE